MSKDLESIRECCANSKSFLIVYDGAGTGDLSVLVCGYCLENKVIFQKFIKSKEPVSETSKLFLKRNV